MAQIKTRIEKLEATAPRAGEERITEIHRMIVGQFNPDGTPRVIVRSPQGLN